MQTVYATLPLAVWPCRSIQPVRHRQRYIRAICAADDRKRRTQRLRPRPHRAQAKAPRLLDSPAAAAVPHDDTPRIRRRLYRKRSLEARLPVAGIDMVGRLEAWSFELTLWLTLTMTRRLAVTAG